jgi:hypothetical protein
MWTAGCASLTTLKEVYGVYRNNMRHMLEEKLVFQIDEENIIHPISLFKYKPTLSSSMGETGSV